MLRKLQKSQKKTPRPLREALSVLADSTCKTSTPQLQKQLRGILFAIVPELR